MTPKIYRPIILSLFTVFLLSSAFGERKVSAERQKLIDYGLTLQGTRYVYGGKQPETGLDCSGFVAYTVKEALGKNYFVSAATMYTMMEHISPEEKEPGDLIFFAVKNGNTYKITHVGIYLGLYHGKGALNGERIFLHSASDGRYTGVIVNSINDNYWKNYVYGYARFLPPTSTETEQTDKIEKEEIVQASGICQDDMIFLEQTLFIANKETETEEKSKIQTPDITEDLANEDKKKISETPTNS